MTHEIEALLSFIQQSPSPAHTVAAAAARLRGAGFAELSLAEDWQLAAGGQIGRASCRERV